MTPLPRPIAMIACAAVLAGALTSGASTSAVALATAPTTVGATTSAATAPATREELDHGDTSSATDVTALPEPAAQALVEGRYLQHSNLTPTGRFVRAGEQLTFDVAASGNPVGYAVVASGVYGDLNGGASGNRAPATTDLPAGTTGVTAASDGLVYLSSTGTAGSTHVRVTGGAPQPVFQLGTTTEADLDAQLTRWPDSRFVLLLGERVIGEFQRAEVDKARANPTWNPERTVGYWDRGAELVAEAHGMDPAAGGVARPGGHRVRIINPDTGAGWASATHGVIVFQKDTGAGQHLLGALPGSDQWGLWHEIGHTYQNPAYRWDGMGEVTVNIYASYAQRHLGVPSRYTRTQDAVYRARNLHAQPVEQRAASGPSHEVMFEQLGRAFGDAFYPRLNQEYRVLAATGGDVPATDDRRKQHLIRTASHVSGYDLSEFFRQWGVPADDATLADVQSLHDLPSPIWTNLIPDAMPLVSDLPDYVLPTGSLDGTGLPEVTTGWTTAPEGWSDRVSGVGSLDGRTGARVEGAGVTAATGTGHLWVQLANFAGVREALTTPLPTTRGNGATFRGLSDHVALTLSLAPDTATWAVHSTSPWVHDSFRGQQYLSVELRAPDGVGLGAASVAGDQSARGVAAALHGLRYEEGQYLLVHHRHPARLDLFVDGARQQRATGQDQAFRVVGGRLQPVARGDVAEPPVLTVEAGIGSTVATLTMSTAVFEQASRHVVRQGDAYVFEIYRGTAPYANVARGADGTVTVTLIVPTDKGDVSLHRTPGKPGQSMSGSTLVSTHPATSTQPTAAQRNALLGFDVAHGTLRLRLSGAAYDSDVRHVVLVNGRVVFETLAGSVRSARRVSIGGITVLEDSVPGLAAGDVVEVRLASGRLGDAPLGVTGQTYTVTAADVAPR